MKEKHTLSYVPKEQSKVKVFDRGTRGSWEKRGATDAITRANAIAIELLKTHKPAPLDPDVHAEMKKIIADAEK